MAFIHQSQVQRKEGRHKCNYCLYSSNQITNLRHHIATHTGEKPFKCDVCGKKFIQKEHDCIPMQSRGSDQFQNKGHRHQCNFCAYATDYFTNLKHHLATHTGERPFKCNVCHKGFIRKDKLRYHLFQKHGFKL